MKLSEKGSGSQQQLTEHLAPVSHLFLRAFPAPTVHRSFILLRKTKAAWIHLGLQLFKRESTGRRAYVSGIKLRSDPAPDATAAPAFPIPRPLRRVRASSLVPPALRTLKALALCCLQRGNNSLPKTIMLHNSYAISLQVSLCESLFF